MPRPCPMKRVSYIYKCQVLSIHSFYLTNTVESSFHSFSFIVIRADFPAHILV
uniref:Uncharacterized protein n=1 Tax=Rhizophora mucronata TaxID=61149 RepID=A0A2P2P050_RHIMU